MKKFLLLTLSFLFLFGWYRNSKEVYIDNGIYKVIYSEKYKEPTITMYKLEWVKVKKKSKNNCFFHFSPKVSEKYQYNPKDYSGKIYDRGHSANKASLDDTPLHKCITYEMINIVPQTHYFNSKIWGLTEQFERILAKEYKVVYVYNIFIHDNFKDKGLYIPKYQIKLIYVPKIKKMFGFLFPRKFQYIKINPLEAFYLAHFDDKFRDRFLAHYNIKFYFRGVEAPILVYKGSIYKLK